MKKGFTLIEIIISLSIFGIFVALFFNFFYMNRNSYENVSTNNKALLIASEGIEATRFLSDLNYVNLINGDHGLEISGGTWNFNGISDSNGVFERTINISDLSTDVKKIQSKVTYELFGQQKEISLYTYLSDWNRELPASLCLPQNTSLNLDTSVANLSNGGTSLNSIYLEDIASDCDLVITDIVVSWNPNNPKTQFNEIIIDGNTVWSGSKNRNSSVDIVDTLISPGDSLELEVNFDDDVSGRTFSIRFVMSDGTNSNFNVSIQ